MCARLSVFHSTHKVAQIGANLVAKQPGCQTAGQVLVYSDSYSFWVVGLGKSLCLSLSLSCWYSVSLSAGFRTTLTMLTRRRQQRLLQVVDIFAILLELEASRSGEQETSLSICFCLLDGSKKKSRSRVQTFDYYCQ